MGSVPSIFDPTAIVFLAAAWPQEKCYGYLTVRYCRCRKTCLECVGGHQEAVSEALHFGRPTYPLQFPKADVAIWLNWRRDWGSLQTGRFRA